MFYESEPEDVLRFGDVVRGYVLSTPRIDSPGISPPVRYRVEVHSPMFAVIMSPCCSIGDGTLAISPLIEVLPGFFKNPYFVYDLTNINRRMSPDKAVAPDIWGGLPESERQGRLSAGDAYALVEYFIYAPHDFLPKYTVNRKGGPIQTGYYMLDFRRIYRIECDKVANAKQAPLEPRLLQISIETRGELRDKLAWYFGRTPKEDML
ncbi:MAG: hypothetical protein JW955_16540 [Sedimentisphaerales bacterium]|nr:hypothetical protein [Sedimentisphaerales bacterium]